LEAAAEENLDDDHELAIERVCALDDLISHYKEGTVAVIVCTNYLIFAPYWPNAVKGADRV
jgi:hypothetical protein